MIRDLVSTIIPVYNRPKMLVEAVGSVLAQTHRSIEIIIVDDGSTDSTAEVIETLAALHSEIRPARRENGGVGLARESGRRMAQGEFIQYLDSDDLLLPRKFALQVEALRSHPECGVAYGYTRYLNDAGQEIVCDWKKANQVQQTMFPSFLVSRWWDTATPLYRASVCDAAGPWTDLRLEEDWEYDCRIAALGTRICLVPELVATVRVHEQSRLGRGQAIDPERLRNRAPAHAMIFAHAQRAAVSPESEEMQHFARELFLLSRQCGAAGLVSESRELFELASQASPRQRKRWQLPIYRSLAGILGWKTLGRASVLLDRFR